MSKMVLDRNVMEGMCQRNPRSSNLVRPKVRDLRLKGVWSPVSSVESRHIPETVGCHCPWWIPCYFSFGIELEAARWAWGGGKAGAGRARRKPVPTEGFDKGSIKATAAEMDGGRGRS